MQPALPRPQGEERQLSAAVAHEDPRPTGAGHLVALRRDTGSASVGSAVVDAEVHDAHTRPILSQRRCLCGEFGLDDLAVE